MTLSVPAVVLQLSRGLYRFSGSPRCLVWEVTATLPLTIQEPVALRPPTGLQPQLRPPPHPCLPLPPPLLQLGFRNHPWRHSLGL